MAVEATEQLDLKDAPNMPGGLPWLGHITSFARNPYHFMKRVSDAAGEVVSFTLMGQRVVLLTGDEASRLFYRSTDDEVDQSAAYKLMTPIFGQGLVFDAPNAKKNEQLRMLMPVLKIDAMRTHSSKVVQEVEDITADWGDSGEIDLVSFMAQLTINTASHCLLGKEFRYELTDEFSEIYHDLEKGIHPLAFHFPNLPLPRFKKRDQARVRLEELVGEIVEKRKHLTEKPSDMLQSLIDAEYKNGEKLTHNEITGLLVAAIFAGHHTSSGTAAWVLLELLKHPHLYRQSQQELDDLLGAEGEVTFDNLRQVPTLENVLKEVLRLHPPLILLMRQVLVDGLHVKGFKINKDDMLWACPPVTHRMSKHFPNPEVFDIERYNDERKEDRNLMAYQPFGGGKHKCSGNAFATFQIKAIFAVLLRRYDFELVAAPETYVDNYKEMIVQPLSPCKVRYRKRTNVPEGYGSVGKEGAPAMGCPMHGKPATPEKGKTAKEKPAQEAPVAKEPQPKEKKAEKTNAAACPVTAKATAETTAKVTAEPQTACPVDATSVAAPAEQEQAAEKKIAYKVVVDRQLCQGHAVCMGEDATRFQVGDDFLLNILKEDVAPEELDKVRGQINYCPNQALSISEEEV